MAKVKSVKATTGDTVTVACKLPNGLILRVFDMIETQEPVMGGGFRNVKIARLKGVPIPVYGNRSPFGELPKCKIVAGFALTPGIPKEFWELYLEQNKDSEVIRNGILFAHESLDSVEGEAKENADVKTGLQPLSRDSRGNMDDSRIPKRINTADEQPKAV